mgnify:CR=1 FL=1
MILISLRELDGFLEKGKLIFDGTVESAINQHINTDYEFIVIKEGRRETLCIKSCERDSFLKSCLEDGIELFSCTPKRATLEEIFYKVKEQESGFQNE